MWCWGLNDKGQLGNNTTANSSYPVQVKGPGGTGTLADVAVVAAAGCCSRVRPKTDYTVWCWGDNANGQLGTTPPPTRLGPGPGEGRRWAGRCPAWSVAAGESHSCAVKSDGTVWCWGRNDKGQLGDNSTASSLVPVQVKARAGRDR